MSMSQWTELTGHVQMDKAATVEAIRLLTQEDLPTGSERSTKVDLLGIDFPGYICIHGNLRDMGQEDVDDIVGWFTGAVVEEAELTIDTDGPRYLFRYIDGTMQLVVWPLYQAALIEGTRRG